MKTLIINVVILVVLLSTFVAEGASTPVPAFTNFVGFGSMENAINDYAVPGSISLGVWIYQQTPSGVVSVKHPEGTNRTFTSKNDIDLQFQKLLNSVASGALTNTRVNKDTEFQIISESSRLIKDFDRIKYLYNYSGFYLTKSEDGSYHLPDFSNHKLELVGSMLYQIPNLEWARIEISYNPATTGLSNLVYSVDSRTHPPDGSFTEIDPQLDYLQVSTSEATSGVTGNTVIKISIIVREGTNYVFKVFGPMGTQIPETPIRVSNFKIVDNVASFSIEGGDCGRVVAVQEGPSPIGPWSDCETLVIPPYGIELKFQKECSGNPAFYRIRSVNAVPVGL